MRASRGPTTSPTSEVGGWKCGCADIGLLAVYISPYIGNKAAKIDSIKVLSHSSPHQI